MQALPDAAPQPSTLLAHSLGTNPQARPFRYRLAGRVFCAAVPVRQLQAFATCDLPSHAGEMRIEPPGWERTVEGFVAQRSRRIRVAVADNGIILDIAHLGQFEISWQGEITAAAPLDEFLWAQVLCGPLLPLALACQGVFMIHAAANLLAGQAVALMASSGAGKSTLCRLLAGRGCAPLADDALALAPSHAPSPDSSPARCAGQSPQPKWPSWRCQWPEAQPPIGGLVLLAPEAGHESALQALSPSAATLALARHTVASALFPPGLLERHLHWCARMAAQAPCLALTYDRRPAQLPAMAGLIVNRFGG